jgi:hypothetical protein
MQILWISAFEEGGSSCSRQGIDGITTDRGPLPPVNSLMFDSGSVRLTSVVDFQTILLISYIDMQMLETLTRNRLTEVRQKKASESETI